MITADRSLGRRKQSLLSYFRDRAKESLEDIGRTFGVAEYRARARAINTAMVEARKNVIKAVQRKAAKESWSSQDTLESVLMTTYTSYIVMIECRNEVWPYEYMTFSRRIGELWEPFCKLCFDFSLRDLTPFIPPLFSQVKKQFTTEIEDYIDRLNISRRQKAQLKRYYNRVWSLVTSGEIKLELDLHFEQGGERFVVDFKSGFGSNEKGNTNRLLLVATVYKNLEENYRCLLLVRAEEDRNNNYFQTLKNSGIWEAHCGGQAYAKIEEHTGFQIRQWITKNVNWENDFDRETIAYFRDNNLDQYLKW